MIHQLMFGTGNVKNCLRRFKPKGGLLALLTGIFMHTTTYTQYTLDAFLAGTEKLNAKNRQTDRHNACGLSICYPAVSSGKILAFLAHLSRRLPGSL